MVKFQLLHNDNIKSLPVVADEFVNHRSYESTFIGTLCEGMPVLGSIIPHYYIRPHMIGSSVAASTEPVGQEFNTGLPMYSLHDVTVALADSVHGTGFLDNKYVVIGNFDKQDLHHTPVGIMPGALILYNTFLTLNEGSQFISLSWGIFIVLMFSLLSFLVFFKGFPHYHFGGNGLSQYLLHSFLANFLSVAFFVTMVSGISYAFFHTHVNILFISLYYSLLSDIIKYRKNENPV